MKRTFLLWISIFMVVISCIPDCVESHMRELTENELRIISYEKGDTVYFSDQNDSIYFVICTNKEYKEKKWGYETVECASGADLNIYYSLALNFESNIKYLEDFDIEIESLSE